MKKIVLAAALLLTSGCASFYPRNAEIIRGTDGTIGGSWALAAVQGVPVSPGTMSMTFAQGGQFSGKFQCMPLRANYNIVPGRIMFRNMSPNGPMCAGGNAALFKQVRASLFPATSAYVSRDGQGLTIAGRRELRFRRVG